MFDIWELINNNDIDIRNGIYYEFTNTYDEVFVKNSIE